MMTAESRRALCVAVDIKSWSGRLVPEQIRAQQALVTVVLAACREAGLPEQIVQESGDGVLLIPPSGIDENQVIPDLVRGLRTALHQENRMLAADARIRLRLSLTTGTVTKGLAGYSGIAVVECFRLLDSKPLKAALDGHPAAELAVVVSDALYKDVVVNGFRDLKAEDFWPDDVSIPDKGFTASAWFYVSDRSGARVPGPAARPAPAGEVAAARALLAEHKPDEALQLLEASTGRDVATVLDVRADAHIALGDFQQAIAVLEQLLLLADGAGSADALRRFAQCQIRVGELVKAEGTLSHLLKHYPDDAEGRLEQARLYRLKARSAAAYEQLVVGLRLAVEADPLDRALLRRFTDELTELSWGDS